MTQSLATPDGLIGRVISGKYRIDEAIGTGGMGRVYRATQLVLEKAVAVKLLHTQYSNSPQLVERFHREARAASRISHPNVVVIIDFGQERDGTLFMVMELLRGLSVEHIAHKQFPVSERRIAYIGMQICNALSAAHAQGIIHRDLKATNVVVENRRDGADFVKLFDFGVCKIETPGVTPRALTAEGMVFGTPEYMAPEQAQGAPYDHRVDIYALGIVLYQLCSARLPFAATNPADVLNMQVSEQPVPPNDLDCGRRVSRELQAVVMRCLEKDPAARFQSAQQLARELFELFQRLGQQSESGRQARPEPNIQHATLVMAPLLQEERGGAMTTASEIAVGGATLVDLPQTLTHVDLNAEQAQTTLIPALQAPISLLSHPTLHSPIPVAEPVLPPTGAFDELLTTGAHVVDTGWRSRRAWLGLGAVGALALGAALVWQRGLSPGVPPAGAEEIVAAALPIEPAAVQPIDAAVDGSTPIADAAVASPAPATIAGALDSGSVEVKDLDASRRDGAAKAPAPAPAVPAATASQTRSRPAAHDAQHLLARRIKAAMLRGDQRHGVGDYAEALKHYHDAQRLSPRSAEVHLKLGMAYYNLGRIDEACDELHTSLELRPQKSRGRELQDWVQELCEAAASPGARHRR